MAMTPEQALQKAKEAATVKAIARRCGVTTEAVYQWNRVPPQHVISVEAATLKDGAPRVTRYDLRPDLYPR